MSSESTEAALFETRYRNLVADALEGEQLIGMVQPVNPRQDNWIDVARDTE